MKTIIKPAVIEDIFNGTSPYMGIVLGVLFVLGIALLTGILFLLTMHNTLKAVSPGNRRMPPGQVWLLLIPVFNLVWAFICVQKISESIEGEFRNRDMYVEPKPAYNIGIAWAVLRCSFIVPVIGFLAVIGEIACFIIYWIKLSEFKKAMQQLPPAGLLDIDMPGNRYR